MNVANIQVERTFNIAHSSIFISDVAINLLSYKLDFTNSSRFVIVVHSRHNDRLQCSSHQMIYYVRSLSAFNTSNFHCAIFYVDPQVAIFYNKTHRFSFSQIRLIASDLVDLNIVIYDIYSVTVLVKIHFRFKDESNLSVRRKLHVSFTYL